MPRTLAYISRYKKNDSTNSLLKIPLSLWALLIIASTTTLFATEQYRTWTDKGGRILEAKFIEKVGEKIKIQRADGRSFTLSPDLFSEKDRKYLESLESELVFKSPEPFTDNYKGAIVIIGVSGKVTIWKRPDDNRYTELKASPAKTGEIIPSGAELETGQGSEALLMLSNGTQAIIGENSRLGLSAFWQVEFESSDNKVSELAEEISPSRIALELKVGELIMDVKKLNKESSLLIETMLSQAGIRGTQFSLISSESSDILGVSEGSVALHNKKQSVETVPQGKSLVLNEIGELTPTKLSTLQLERINESIKKCSEASAQYSIAQLSSAADEANKRGTQNIQDDDGAMQMQIDALIKEHGSIRKIESISVDHTQVSDLSALNQLTELKKLEINGDYRKTILTTLPKLDNLKKLESLRITAAFKLKEHLALEPITDLTNLKSLFLGWTPVHDSSFLLKLKKLERLQINYWKTTDLNHLRNCSELSDIRLSAASELVDISELGNLRKLEYLQMTQTKIEDLSPLKNLRSLKYLSLQASSKIKDFSPLFRLKNLTSLHLKETGISSAEQKRLKRSLPACQISF